MAKNKKQEDEGKKKGKKNGCASGCVIAVIAVILIIFLVISALLSIFESIIETIYNILFGILDFLADPLDVLRNIGHNIVNYFSSMFNGKFDPQYIEKMQPRQLIEISQKQFEDMKDSIDPSIDKAAMGLDDAMLKKMLLTYHTGKYSHNADIIIELTKEEYNTLLTDETNPFAVKMGAEIDQIAMNFAEEFRDMLYGIFGLTSNPNADKQDKYYLCATGVLKFINEAGTELKYYSADVLKNLYIKEFQANRYGSSSDYAKSVWNYISSNCYTDGEKGIAMYSHETVKEEFVQWSFEDKEGDIDSFKDILDLKDKLERRVIINRQKIPEDSLYTADEWLKSIVQLANSEGLDSEAIRNESSNHIGEDSNWLIDAIGIDGIVDTATKEYKLQDIEYYSQVSQYATPVEFMIDLLNITNGSKEFVNAFIDKVTKDTSITLKVYRVSSSNTEEEIEVINEKTTVDYEAVISAEIITGYIDGTTDVDEGGEIKQVNVSTEITEGKEGILYSYEWKENDRIELTFSNIPKKYERLKVRLTFKASGVTKDYYIPSDQWVVDDPLGTSITVAIKPSDFFGLATIEKSKSRNTIAIIKKYKTYLTTETKLDIAVEEAKTWHGKFIYDNNIKTEMISQTKENINDATLVDAPEGKPIMISQTKDPIPYTKDDSNLNTIFATKELDSYFWREVGSRVEGWFTGLKGDDVAYWVLPGGRLANTILTYYGDNGLDLYNDESELLNIRFVYTNENGAVDWWNARYYLPVNMTLEPVPSSEYTYLQDTGYAIGYLYETANVYLEKDPTPTVKDEFGIFLSLLKNDTGTYSKDGQYNPNGVEITYKKVDGSDLKVGERLTTHAEWFFDMLSMSPNTQGLEDIMRYILYKYSTRDYGVTEFKFELFNTNNFIPVETTE